MIIRHGAGLAILGTSILHEFSNAGHMRQGRLFAGFPDAACQNIQLAPRSAHLIQLNDGDLLRIDEMADNSALAILAFSDDGSRQEQALGLALTGQLDQNLFDSLQLSAWMAQKGSALDRHETAVIYQHLPEPLIIKTASKLYLWVIHLHDIYQLVSAQSAAPIQIQHQPNLSHMQLPPPLGHIVDEFTVTRGTARAYRLRKNQYVQIIDVDGQQCSDFQAFSADGLDKGHEFFIDSTATRSMVRRAYPYPGLFDKFFDSQMRPLLKLVQDSCGRHDTFGLACTSRSYADRGFPGHLNCSDNISFALSPYGVAARSAWPAVNFFWNTWLDDHHQILTEEAYSRAGDYVVMQALDELICVSTACPDDLDPINGWNPTDIHVRIYDTHPSIFQAVAYRAKEDAPMQISKPSAFHTRLKALTEHFAPARDVWSAVSFPAHGTIGEYWACRQAATLQDMSGLRKFDIIGPDAEALLQLAMSRDIAKLAQWRGTYALLCDHSGEVIDDGTLFRLEPHIFRWCCGAEESGRWLSGLAKEHQFQVRIHDLGGALPNLALQGPASRDILRKILFTQPSVPNLEQMKWFGVSVGRLHDREGAPFMLSRTGYTGELGYEIFCAESDALEIWDVIMAAGEEFGLLPMGSAALEIIRIEAGLASRAEFSAGADAFEAGLGFAVDMGKTDFIGKSALMRNKDAQRRKLVGLRFECDDVPAHGAPIYDGERQIGQITSATRSPLCETAIAMGRISMENANSGEEVEVGQLDGRMKRLTAKIVSLPFVDPQRQRARG